ncbi:hypothetical protein QWZ14_20530 [Paeniroseomonas aquatica]|uniref:Uncharacterized protein n=2 Tax=Paeniroseomonas aquatica TaxID=373043 RepID=A0ABT8AAC8_9PROT|nr:hypothetical protein [Paeniroseomonas aquatica]MDN3566769.1 hypothetical protein [Paeniroseomonas aquatica]
MVRPAAPMTAALLPGLLYFLAVFAVAFAMGVARVLVVAPRIGPTAAVLLEVPMILVVSWAVARRILRHRVLTLPQRATMGATAFALTMASEIALAGVLRGQGVMDWAAATATPLGLVGLAGQVAFAALPMVLGRRATPPTA